MNLNKVAQFADRLVFGGRISKALRTSLSNVDGHGGGWVPIIRDWYTGAWQRNDSIDFSTASTFHADFSCKTLIASDFSKLRVKLMQRDKDQIWLETTNPAYSPVLRKPNHFQTRNQFWETWCLSKLNRGNTYALKQYDNRDVVTALYVLDPNRCFPLVAEDGSVFYRLNSDKLSGLPDEVIVPARNIIHDRMNCLFHPLVGIPPLYASALAAMQGLNIQHQSARLFQNNSSPGGILTAPGEIKAATAERIKSHWEQNFSGRNVGRVAVLGDGLKYEKMTFTAVEGQLIEQLKWTAEVVCSTYHVPPYKIGVGAMPSYNNVQALNVEYYSQCLQSLIEAAEECLDEGLGIGWGVGLGTEFDVDNLLRMDSVTQVDMLDKARNLMTPNEGRKVLNLLPVTGGDSVYRQQQDFSVEALSKRDAQDDPFSTAPAVSAGSVEFETLKSTFDAYGVGVRAGAITPQVDDEKQFREMAGFPAPSTAVTDVWSTEPIRRPITLKSVGDDPVLAESSTVDDDGEDAANADNSEPKPSKDEAEKNTQSFHAPPEFYDAIIGLAKRFDAVDRESAKDDAPVETDDELSACKAMLAWEMADLTLELPDIKAAA